MLSDDRSLTLSLNQVYPDRLVLRIQVLVYLLLAGLLSLAGHPGIPGLPPTSLAQLMGHREMKEEKPLSAMEERLKHSSSASPASRSVVTD